jgi:hypothetical protein
VALNSAAGRKIHHKDIQQRHVLLSTILALPAQAQQHDEKNRRQG